MISVAWPSTHLHPQPPPTPTPTPTAIAPSNTTIITTRAHTHSRLPLQVSAVHAMRETGAGIAEGLDTVATKAAGAVEAAKEKLGLGGK